MKYLLLRCDGCGAPLEVPKKLRHITCEYCEAEFHVPPTPPATPPAAPPRAPRPHKQAMLRKLDEIDAEWLQSRGQFARRGHENEASVMTRLGTALAGTGVAGFGVFWIIAAASVAAPCCVPFAGIGIVIGGLVIATRRPKRTQRFESLREEYRLRRRALLRGED